MTFANPLTPASSVPPYGLISKATCEAVGSSSFLFVVFFFHLRDQFALLEAHGDARHHERSDITYCLLFVHQIRNQSIKIATSFKYPCCSNGMLLTCKIRGIMQVV
jgi:hypothetical protein